MNKKYTAAQLLMLKGLIGFAFDAGNTAITNSIAALLAAFTVLKGFVTSVDDMLAQYAKVITGWAEQKRLARLTLANTTYTIVKAVRAYAIANNDWTLANQMKTSLSVLKKTGYETLLEKVNGWITTVSPLVATLGDYGITTTLFNQWKTDRDALTNLLTAPKAAIDAHTVLGSNIETTMKEAMTLTKEQIDGIVANLMETQPAYYNGYHQSRKINVTGIRHTGLEATVTDELGQPMVGVTVTVDVLMKDDRTFKSVSGITDEKGFVHISTFESGIRNVTIEGHAVINKTFTDLKFVHGQILKKTFIMQPSFNNLPQTTQPTETTPVQ